jgi:ribose transport system permease protein
MKFTQNNFLKTSHNSGDLKMNSNEMISSKSLAKRQIIDEILVKWGIYIALFLLVSLMIVIAPNFFSIQNGLNIAQAVSINAVLASGMTVVILTAGIDLSVGSIVAASGVATVLLLNGGVPTAIAALFAILVGALIGFINGAIIAYLALPAFIVTLGALTYTRGIAYSMHGGPVEITGESGIESIGNGSIGGIPMPVFIMIFVYSFFWFLLERTKFGRHVYAVGGNPQAARLSGINVKKVLMSVYVISGITAGLGGLMFASRVRSGQVTAGVGYELDAITAVILGGTSLFGGRGRIFGTLIGALLLGVLSNGLVLLGVPIYTQLMIKGAVVILAVAIDTLRSKR